MALITFNHQILCKSRVDFNSFSLTSCHFKDFRDFFLGIKAPAAGHFQTGQTDRLVRRLSRDRLLSRRAPPTRRSAGSRGTIELTRSIIHIPWTLAWDRLLVAQTCSILLDTTSARPLHVDGPARERI